MSEAVEWDDSLKIGQEDIDNQHKKLFNIAQRLENIETSAIDEKEQIKKILYDLREYMVYHFEEEEAYMSKIHYPALNEHKTLHQKIINDIRSVMKGSLRLNVLKIRINTFVKKWLVEHIIQEDMKIQAWLQAQNGSSSETFIDLDTL